MSVATSHRPAETRIQARRPKSIYALAILMGLLAVGAIQGGIAMVIDPIEPLGMSVEFLEGTPVDDYLLPGLFLLGIAGTSTVTIPGLVFGWRWGWAARIERLVGYRWPWLAASAVGGVLLTFEIVELFVVPFHPVMHPLLITGSLAILVLATSRSARNYLRAR